MEDWRRVIWFIIAVHLEGLSFIYQRLLRVIRRIAFLILRQGRIPRHVAFIMDGNRRYATRKGLPSKTQGHIHGFLKLEEILEWSLELGVQEVTIYAFSIENFRRSEEEVDMLMRLAMEKLEEVSLHSELIRKYEVRIRVVGELRLLPEAVRRAACVAMCHTRHYSKHTINVCLPFTSTNEILHASNMMLESGLPPTASRLSQLMYIKRPDIIVRTSGERRLSDFLTWQCTQRPTPMIAFVDALWPEFGLRDLLLVLLRYQIHHGGGTDGDLVRATTDVPLWMEMLSEQEELYWKQIIQWSSPLGGNYLCKVVSAK